jgi:2'-5' RNA ligase
LLEYSETSWKHETGSDIQKYRFTIATLSPSKVSREQRTKIEKISLIAFLDANQKKPFVKICRRLKQNNKHFYQNKNLHATLFGFGPKSKQDYQAIKRKIQLFTKSRKATLTIKIDSIRPGSSYYGNSTLKPIDGLGNGTVIAIGDISNNIEFSNYADSLTKYLLNNNNIKAILGKNFRRKFPNVWVTLGYYDKKDTFKIDTVMEDIFKQYKELEKDISIPISEISLVKSKYKNLRYPKLIQKFQI